MTFRPAPNVVQIQMLYNQLGETMENVYNVQFAGAVTESELNTLVDAFIEWENTLAHLQRDASVALVQVIATDLTSEVAARLVVPVSPPIAGAKPDDPMPGNVTMSVHANSTARGRGTQGRTYWIGFSEAMVDGNFVLNSVVDLITVALAELITLVNAVDGATLSTLHGQEGGVPLNPRTTSPITSWVCKDNIVDSQKSRLPGHRRHKRAPIVP